MSGPHAGARLMSAGAPLEEARGVVILVHGRGASAQDILSLAPEFGVKDLAFLAPQAAGGSWYPMSFLAPLERNEPGLSSALELLGQTVRQVEEKGFAAEKIVVGGFSQGACLSLEFVARNARRYGAVLAFSGGLIGPPDTPRDYAGSFENTPVFLGCSDMDPHIPLERVQESTAVFERMGAAVTERIYPRMPHTINEDEILFARKLLSAL